MRLSYLLIIASLVLGFSVDNEPDRDLAQVNQYQGLYIFVDCTPVAEYEYLGTVKQTFVWTGEYEEVRDALIRKAKKKYPDADAVIVNMQIWGRDKADVIRFK